MGPRRGVLGVGFRSAYRIGLPDFRRVHLQRLRAFERVYSTVCGTTTHPSDLHDLLDCLVMPKRRNAVGGVFEDVDSVTGVKKSKVLKSDDQKMPAAIRKDKLVEDVNALSIHDFRSRFVDENAFEYSPDCTGTSSSFQVSIVAADWLAPGEYNAAFHLIEETSRPDYESSTFGWHPRRKRKEMLEPEMKYLLVRHKDTGPTIKRTKECGDVDTSILGFLSCMVDYDSSPPVPVLYIYEIHLAEPLRGLGLGNHLMHIAGLVAQSIGLTKIMLTCFLCNEKAYRFYADRGFRKDACSPEDRKTRNKVVAVDYAILSKDV
jgi:ribosomal protein S18 acetylase RimI-like enzyme